LTQKR